VSFYPRVSTPADTEDQPSAETSERAVTGVLGLDDLLGGGLPCGSLTILQGRTGTGKTLLGLQYLIEGAHRGEKGVFFTLEETPAQLRAIARSVGWDLAALEDQGLLAIKYTVPVELSTDRCIYRARMEVKELGASRAVFDSLTTLALGASSARRFKAMVYAISKHMRGNGVTMLMTVDSDQTLGTINLTSDGVAFIADNLIQLRNHASGRRFERAISVIKARGVKHQMDTRAFVIGKGGLTVGDAIDAISRGSASPRDDRSGSLP
jgi:circadian clock protein KaiC